MRCPHCGREIVRKITKASSDNQRAYYFKVIVGAVSEQFGYGPEERDQVHYALKDKFLGVPQDNGLVLVPSYRDLDTAQTEEYHENIRRWMLTEHGCKIPLPNEVPEPEYDLN
ncbi:MAG: hypothetical protein GX465_16460 [Acidobacteria bacterium]|nr:hypothetical protein [Acidobacteriota bacterium]